MKKRANGNKKAAQDSIGKGPSIAKPRQPLYSSGVPVDSIIAPSVRQETPCACDGECPLCSGGVQSTGTKGEGQPLPDTLREFYEQRFRHDFSDIRLHTDTPAADSAAGLEAQAYTEGRDIVFAKGKYSPDTKAGRKLLAHELTHVVQQGGKRQQGLIQRKENNAEQAKRLKALNDEALATAKRETKFTRAGHLWAKTINSTHLTNLKKVLTYLNTSIISLKAGIKKLDPALKKLWEAMGIIDKARKDARRLRARGYPELGPVYNFAKAKTSVDKAITLLKESKASGVKGLGPWISTLTALSAKLQKKFALYRIRKRVNLQELRTLRGEIKTIRSNFFTKASGLRGSPAAAEEVQFVLRYFLALNEPGYPGAPTLSEAVAIRGRISSIASYMVRLFNGKAKDYQLFENFAVQIREQIQVREEMKKVLGKDPGLKPGIADVKKWFTSMKTSSNQAVKDAYTSFASAYFIHRIDADPAFVRAKKTLPGLMARTPTISGARLVVCSGFAVLGATLLKLAGARFKKYYVGIRASDKQIKCSFKYDDVHAIAHLTRQEPTTRKNEDIYVSNADIVSTKDDGLGPNAVAWDKKTNPIYEGKGASIQAAVKHAQKKMDKRRRMRTVKQISCK